MGQTIFFKYPLACPRQIGYYTHITRAVPLVRKVNAHNGRVFYFTHAMTVGGAS